MEPLTNRIDPKGEIPEDPLLNYPENLIINRPDLKSRTLIFGEKVITVIFWGFWFYLWLPLISVLAWILGFRVLYTHMVELGGFEGFLQQFDTFTIGIILVSGTLALWSFYNLKRYGAYTRRNKVLLTDTGSLLDSFSISEEEFSRIQRNRNISFFFDEQNTVSSVKTSFPIQ